jgi:hypothetical protein
VRFLLEIIWQIVEFIGALCLLMLTICVVLAVVYGVIYAFGA